MNKHLKRLIQVIGGMMMMTLLTGCSLKMSEEDAVKAELAPLYQVLDQQSLEGYDVLSIKDSMDIYGTKSIKGYQIDVDKNELGQFVGKGYDFSISEEEGYDARYEDGKIIVETDIQELRDFQFLFDTFHFSETYLKGLNQTGFIDHPETYMKEVVYEEIVPSEYAKELIDQFQMTNPTPAIVSLGKRMRVESHDTAEGRAINERNIYIYILSYSLYDDVKNGVDVQRTFTFQLEEKE